MTGCRCNDGLSRKRPLLSDARRLFPALTLVALLSAQPALALNPPTELTPQEPPVSGGQPLQPPSGNGASIESEPLPQPDMLPQQPEMEPGANGAQPLPQGAMPQQPAAQPLPAAATPPSAQPPAAIGADLGPNLWFGSQLSTLMGLFPRLPAPVTVPSVRDLQLRLLTTQASPQGMSPGADPLVPFRAERLNAMGFSDVALSLTQSAASAPPATPQDAVEQMLTKGDARSACDRVDAEAAGGSVPDLFWRKAIIFCQLSRQQVDQAEIGLDLLREGGGKDPSTANFIAAAAVAAGDAPAKSIKKPIQTSEPVLVAMLKLAGLPAPTGGGMVAPKAVGPAAWVATYRDTTQPIADRIGAAEHAFAAGLIGRDELVAIYAAVPIVPGDPVAGVAASDSPLTRAVLYNAAASASLPDQRARLVQAALQRARGRGDYFAEVALYAPIAQQVQPARDLAWFAPEATRVMFLSGNADRGGFWLNIVDTSSGNPDVARQGPGLRLLGRIARGAGSPLGSGDPVASWQQATGAGQQQAQQIYAIFAGLGQRIGGWTGITPIMQAGSMAAQINAAALGGRHGETILTALVAMGGDKLAATDPAALAASLGGLTSIGLGKEARQIALEAGVLVGL
jgi:hypothetical protein